MTVQASDPRSGWFRFLHHETPLEWSNNVDERLAYIQKKKPPHEVGGRLAAIIRIPDDAVPLALREAERAYEEARRAYRETERAGEEAERAYEEARRACEEAERAYNTIDFVLQFGPLPKGVTWNGKELIFASA